MKSASKVLSRLEAMGKQEFIPSIGPVKGRIIARVIEKHRPKRILEIGTLYGYSAILMAALLPVEGKIVTIETDRGNAEFARKNILDAGLKDRIEVMEGDAMEILHSLPGKFDLLFIDARKEEYLGYLKLAEKNLENDSVVIADNVKLFADEMKDYLSYVRGSDRYESTTIDVPPEFSDGVEDAMEISISKVKG